MQVDTQKGADVYESLSRFINSNSRDQEAFLESFMKDHRTLQQGVIRLLLTLIERQAGNKYGDARNQASIQVCRTLIDTFKSENNGISPTEFLPFI